MTMQADYFIHSPKAVPAASASGFDAFFGGQATVVALGEDLKAGYSGGGGDRKWSGGRGGRG